VGSAAPETGRKVLVAEPDAATRREIRHACEQDGYQVIEADTGAETLRQVEQVRPTIVLLEVTLPDVAGFDICRELRKIDTGVPVIMMSSRSDEIDVVVALEIGADDYVTKPFGVLEVLARIGALLRRANRYASLRQVERFGGIDVNRDTRIVTRHGRPVELSPMEFALLIALLSRRGATASRLELLQEVWGHSAAVITRTVDTHIAELRRKLEDHPAQPAHILTVRKVGYRLAGGPPAASL
jgi:DNA-binding response OmpR family regulator